MIDQEALEAIDGVVIDEVATLVVEIGVAASGQADMVVVTWTVEVREVTEGVRVGVVATVTTETLEEDRMEQVLAAKGLTEEDEQQIIRNEKF